MLYCHPAKNTRPNSPCTYYSPRLNKPCSRCCNCACKPNSRMEPVQKPKKVQIIESSKVQPKEAQREPVAKAQVNQPVIAPQSVQTRFMKEVIARNDDYFKERVKVCCEVRPNQYNLKLPGRTGKTTYQKDYLPKSRSESSFPKFEPYSPRLPAQYQTSYRNDYIPHKTQPIAPSPRAQYKPQSGPTYMQTVYDTDYGSFKKPLPKDLNIFKPHNAISPGGRFDGTTVYRFDYVPKQAQGGREKHKDKDYQLFTNLKIPKKSHYNREYVKKNKSPQSNFKPKQYHIEQPAYNYDTQYIGEYFPKTAEHCTYKNKDLSRQQLQQMIMNL